MSTTRFRCRNVDLVSSRPGINFSPGASISKHRASWRSGAMFTFRAESSRGSCRIRCAAIEHVGWRSEARVLRGNRDTHAIRLESALVNRVRGR